MDPFQHLDSLIQDKLILILYLYNYLNYFLHINVIIIRVL